MSVSALLELLQITDTQSEKMAALNTIMSQIEQVVAGTYTLATSSGVTVYTLPYDNTSDLSDRTALRFVRLRITAGANSNFTVVHPASPHLFAVQNDTLYTASFDAGGVIIQVQPQTGQLVYCDGTDFFLMLSDTRSVAADFFISYWGTPAASEVVADILVARDTTVPISLVGAVGRSGSISGSASARVFDIYDDGVKFAEATIAPNGSVSFANTGTAAARIISAGKRLRMIAPATEEPSLVDFQFTIPATALL